MQLVRSIVFIRHPHTFMVRRVDPAFGRGKYTVLEEGRRIWPEIAGLSLPVLLFAEVEYFSYCAGR